jgi:hypothetical protein
MDPFRCSTNELVGDIHQLHTTISSAHRRLLRAIAEFDRREAWAADGCRNMAGWLSAHLGISVSQAFRWTKAAHALEDLPLLAAALENGTLSLDKTIELARFATPATQESLIRWAEKASVPAIRRKADVANRPSLDDTTAAQRARYFRWWTFDDGACMGVEGVLPSADGAAVAKALTRLASSLPEDPDCHDGLEERCADALVAMARARIAEDQDSDRATVVLHVNLDDVVRYGPGGEIDGGPVVHPEVALRMMCDCRLECVVGDGGRTIGIGRASRTPSPWLLRQLFHRDRGCTFPGCGATRFLQAHHVRHWIRGGHTNLDNLMLVCFFHHKLVHEHNWSVKLDRDERAQWFRPDGNRHQPRPPPSPAPAPTSHAAV